jgi:hypothetical protein
VVACGEREDDELVAADPGHGVAGSDDCLEASRQRAQDRIAGAVTADVVDVLEAVEVDGDERERLVRPACTIERLLDAILEQHPVRQPGERIA